MLNKDYVKLWSAVIETYFEDAKDVGYDYDEVRDHNIDEEDRSYIGVDFVALIRHARSDHTREILKNLGMDRKAFLTALKATRRQALFEYNQRDNLKYKEETTKFKSIA